MSATGSSRNGEVGLGLYYHPSSSLKLGRYYDPFHVTRYSNEYEEPPDTPVSSHVTNLIGSTSTPSADHNDPGVVLGGGGPQQQQQQPPVDWSSFPHANYNRFRPLLWIVAGYNITLAGVLCYTEVVHTPRDVIESQLDYWFMFLFGLILDCIELIMGVCLIAGLRKSNPDSTLCYCKCWMKGAQLLTLTSGGSLVFQFLDIRSSPYSSVYWSILLFASRVLALLTVRQFVQDLLNYHYEKQQFLNKLVIMARARGFRVIPPEQGPVSVDDVPGSNTRQEQATGFDAWMTLLATGGIG